MNFPNVPHVYTPRIELARNEALRAADQNNVKKTGVHVVEAELTLNGDVEAAGELDVTGTFKIGGAAFGQAAAQADSVAANVADLVTDFNSLLAKLRAAGLLDT